MEKIGTTWFRNELGEPLCWGWVFVDGDEVVIRIPSVTAYANTLARSIATALVNDSGYHYDDTPDFHGVEEEHEGTEGVPAK